MAGIATGVFKKLFVKRQPALGVIAPAGPAQSAKSMRRVTSTLDVTKASYQSNEVIESQQVRDLRHGVRSTGGTLNGELSVGTYQQQFESILRQNVQGSVTSGALATVTAASTGQFSGTFTRSAGSWLTDGFKVGDVVNMTGQAAPAASNNDQYMVITSLSATVMSCVVLDKTPITVKAAGDNVTFVTVGKKTWVPSTGQTRDYYTVEHWFSDIGVDELYPDTVFTGANVSLPPSGMATVEFPMMGLRFNPAETGDRSVQYFTNPAPPATGANLAAVNGLLIMNGIVAGLVTGLTFNINGQYGYPTGDGSVGSNERPDVLPGVLVVTGQVTILFQDATFRDAFINETESTIMVVLTTDNGPKPGFTSFVMSRVKFSGATKDDTNTGMTQTLPFQALENVANGGAGYPNLQTTISIQDSAFA